MPACKNIFISYAHKDNKTFDGSSCLNLVKMHLKPYLRQQGDFDIWDDTRIRTSEDWHNKIQTSLKGSSAAILLVGPAFLASDYIVSNELPVILEKARKEGLKIYSLIISSCAFLDAEFLYPDPNIGPHKMKLSALQAGNRPDAPLDMMSPGAQNKNLHEFVKTISEDIASMSASASTNTVVPPPPSSPSIHPVYASLIGMAVSDGMLSTWSEFRSFVLAEIPTLSMLRIHAIRRFELQVSRAVWPGIYPELECALKNFAHTLELLVEVINQHASTDERNWLVGCKFYINSENDDDYHRLFKLYIEWTDNYHNALTEAAKAANWLSDIIRRDIDPNFFLLDGYFCAGSPEPPKYTSSEIQSLLIGSEPKTQ